jgi:hypothetical protein
MKTKKPAKNNQSWLGVCGITTAILFNKNGQKIGTTLDAPNPVAYAFSKYKNIASVKGILGFYDMNEIKRRGENLKCWPEYNELSKVFESYLRWV